MNLPDAIDHIRPSIVQFALHSKDTLRPEPFGSGFIIDEDGHFTTAAHIAKQADKLTSAGMRVTIGLAYPNLDNVDFGTIHALTLRSCFYHVGAEVVDVDHANDVALLRMIPNPFTSSLPSMIQSGGISGPQPLYAKCCASTDRPRDGDAIAVSGYPLSAPALVTTGGNIASGWFHEELDVPDASRQRKISVDRYLADVSVNPGKSGGPVYRLSDGCVIGVCSGYRNTPLLYADNQGGIVKINERPVGINAGLCFVSPIGCVVDLLNKVQFHT